MISQEILSALAWRYATKKFDSLRKVPEQELNTLLEVLRVSPSSFGLQPWQFIVISDQKLRETLKPHAFGQPQITDASHLIVLFARTSIDELYIDHYVQDIAKTRSVSIESLKGYHDAMLSSMQSKLPQELTAWSKCQVYLALGHLLSAAALMRIDACPMEGFDPKGFDDTLGLAEKGLTAAVLCTIGYRLPQDTYAQAKKVRFPESWVIVRKDPHKS